MLARIFRRIASLVGIPRIHDRLDALERGAARNVDIEGLQNAINILEARVLEMNAALLDYIDERAGGPAAAGSRATGNVTASDRR